MKFVVAIDNSNQSEAALDHAIDIAAGINGSLTAVHAVDPSVYEEQPNEPIADLSNAEQRLVIEDIEDAEWRGEQILEDAVARAAERDFDLRTELLYGDPVQTLRTFAEGRDFDGLFVGHRDLSKTHERVLGSVAKRLIDQTSIPITVVP